MDEKKRKHHRRELETMLAGAVEFDLICGNDLHEFLKAVDSGQSCKVELRLTVPGRQHHGRDYDGTEWRTSGWDMA